MEKKAYSWILMALISWFGSFAHLKNNPYAQKVMGLIGIALVTCLYVSQRVGLNLSKPHRLSIRERKLPKETSELYFQGKGRRTAGQAKLTAIHSRSSEQSCPEHWTMGSTHTLAR